jgi:predicted ATPase
MHVDGRQPALTGREAEVARLRARLDALVSGRGSLLLVPGEPGIGKTRLAQELASICERAGIPVGWGDCPPAGAVAVDPWVQVTRAVAGADPTPPADGVGHGDVGPDATQAASRRRRYFDDVVERLRQAAPAVVVLEDVHRADAGTLALLGHLATGLPDLAVLVLVTYRDTDVAGNGPLRDLVDAVLDIPACDFLDVPPLRAEAAIECAALASGRRIDPERLVAVIARGGGNPFFIGELVRATAAGVDAALPRSAPAVVRGRLAGLGPDDRRALEALAVLGGQADASLLAGLLSTTADDLTARLGPALAARLVESRPPLVRFPHALVGEVVLADLGPSSRTDLHRRTVDLLRPASGPDAGPGDPGGRAAALAHHALAAEDGGVDADAAAHVLEAGAWKERRFAFEDAAALYARALAGPSGRANRSALLLARGDALVRAGSPAEARSCFEDAVGEAAGDGEVLARASVGLGACAAAADPVTTAGEAEGRVASPLD